MPRTTVLRLQCIKLPQSEVSCVPAVRSLGTAFSNSKGTQLGESSGMNRKTSRKCALERQCAWHSRFEGQASLYLIRPAAAQDLDDVQRWESLEELDFGHAALAGKGQLYC